MQELQGDLWDQFIEGHNVFITTNGDVRRDGRAVMGRGCALEAKQLFPGIDAILGANLCQHGNRCYFLGQKQVLPSGVFARIYSFPVKHHWDEKASLRLVKMSAHFLLELAESEPDAKFFLPRPGCGNGKLLWPDVKNALEAAHLPDNVYVISRPGEK